MSVANLAVAEPAAFSVEDLPLDRPRKSGFVLKPIDVAAATAALQSLTRTMKLSNARPLPI